MLSFAFAICYPGSSYTFQNEMGITNLVYTIVGNSSPIYSLDVDINETNITITFPGNMTPDNFLIVFLENQTNTIVQTIHTYSGGGSRTRYVDRNVTVEVPRFYDRNITVTKEVPADKIVNTVTEVDTGFKLWHILLGMVVGLGFGWLTFREYKQSNIGER